MKWVACILIFTVSNLLGQNAIAFLEAPAREETIELDYNLGFTKVPIEVVKGMILVNAEMDGRTGLFILDTGAPRMVVNSKDKSGTAVAASSFSTAFDIQSTTIKHFKWADVNAQNMEALVVDISHLERSTNRKIMGMIGQNALINREIMVDYAREELFIFPGRKNPIHRAAEPLVTIPFTLQNHLPIVTLKINEIKMHFGLDTGAGTNLIDQKHFDNLPTDTYSNLHLEEIQGLDQSIKTAKTANIHFTLIEDQLFQNMEYLFTDLSHLQVNSGLEIDGLLGYEFFQQFRFSINYQKQKIYIWEFVSRK